LEVLRQRLDGRDPLGECGDELLFSLAEAFLERNPVPVGSYAGRLGVGFEWLEVVAGTTWELEGRTVRVPREAEATYQMIGRFILLDVGRHLEDHVNSGELGTVGFLLSLPWRFLLHEYGITIDVRRSSKRKALEAWVTGDFGYVLDRVLKKAQEKLIDQEASVSRIRSSDMRLETQWSNGSSIRMSDLLRSGTRIGWVAQFDGTAVDLEYSIHDQPGISEADLGSGRTRYLVTSGTYATAARQTSGLAVVDGEVRNFLITPKADGLVIYEPKAGLHMLDMRRGGRLPGESVIIRPLRRISDFSHLRRWLREHRAWAFQTHLLYADGEPRIDAERANPEPRERRLLVDAEYRGHPIIVVVDLPSAVGGYSLYEAMAIVERALRTAQPDGPELDVIGIANLDVGAYDILLAWNDRGEQLRVGRQPLHIGQNLITIIGR
jgi:hypothetical protein